MPAIKQHIQTQKGKDTQLLISASKYRVLNAHGSAKKIPLLATARQEDA